MAFIYKFTSKKTGREVAIKASSETAALAGLADDCDKTVAANLDPRKEIVSSRVVADDAGNWTDSTGRSFAYRYQTAARRAVINQERYDGPNPFPGLQGF